MSAEIARMAESKLTNSKTAVVLVEGDKIHSHEDVGAASLQR